SPCSTHRVLTCRAVTVACFLAAHRSTSRQSCRGFLSQARHPDQSRRNHACLRLLLAQTTARGRESPGGVDPHTAHLAPLRTETASGGACAHWSIGHVHPSSAWPSGGCAQQILLGTDGYPPAWLIHRKQT